MRSIFRIDGISQIDRSLLRKGRVEVSVPAESPGKVSNMHGYAIRAIPRGAKVERIKSGCKKKEKTNDERDRKKKTKECFAREAVDHPFSFVYQKTKLSVPTKGIHNFG